MEDNSRLNKYLETFFSQEKWKGQEATLPLFKKWREIVGDLAVHCNLADLDRGVLLIESDHPGWIQLFQFKELDLLKKLQKAFPKLKIRGFRYKIVTPEFKESIEVEIVETIVEEEKTGETTKLTQNDPFLNDILKKLEP